MNNPHSITMKFTLKSHEQSHENPIKQHKNSIKQHKNTINQHNNPIKQHKNTIKQHKHPIKQHKSAHETCLKNRPKSIGTASPRASSSCWLASWRASVARAQGYKPYRWGLNDAGRIGISPRVGIQNDSVGLISTYLQGLSPNVQNGSLDVDQNPPLTLW